MCSLKKGVPFCSREFGAANEEKQAAAGEFQPLMQSTDQDMEAAEILIDLE